MGVDKLKIHEKYGKLFNYFFIL